MTGVGSVASLLLVLALPMTRGDDQFQQAGIRVGAIAFLALVAGVVLVWAPLIPLAVALAGGMYAAELAIDDSPLDTGAPAVAAGLFLCAELAYWSLDERRRWHTDAGGSLRRLAFVALLGVAAFLVSAVLLALVDAVRARGLALDLAGALAAAAVLAAVLLGARRRLPDEDEAAGQPSNGS